MILPYDYSYIIFNNVYSGLAINELKQTNFENSLNYEFKLTVAKKGQIVFWPHCTQMPSPISLRICLTYQ